MAQMNKLHQALATQTISVSGTFVFLIRFAEMYRYEYQQSYPLNKHEKNRTESLNTATFFPVYQLNINILNILVYFEQ